MWGDILEGLRARNLRITPRLATLRQHVLLAQGAPSNEQIVAATKNFYGGSQALVDGTTENARDVSKSHSDYVAQLNRHNWQTRQLTQAEQDQTSTGLFGATDGAGPGGIFGPTLDKVKASDLFSTITVGVSAEAVLGAGGLGGIGCAWDIAKREGPKGYGYATLELGLKVEIDVNVQACILNKLPSELDTQIYGLCVGAGGGVAAAFTMFFTGMGVDVLGYSISIGVGGGGAAVFGGHIWNFG